MAAAATEETLLVNKSNADKFRELKERWFMRSKIESWTAFVLGCFTLCIASGPLLGWQTLEQNMIDEGCQYSEAELDVIYNWAYGLAIAGTLPGGLLFDYFGPMVVAVGGMVVTGMGLCGMGVALIFSDDLNWLLGPSYVTAVVFSYVNGFGLLSYLWILYEHPFAVNGIYQASFVLADSVALISVELTSCCGVTTGSFYLGLGMLCLAAVSIVYFVLPGNEEVMLLKKYSHSMLSFQGEIKPSIDDIFGAEEPGRKREQNQSFIEFARHRLWDVICIAGWQHPGAVWIFFGNLFMVYMATMTLSINQYSYYLTMFSEAEAIYLCDLFLIVYGIVGPMLALSMGVFFDKSGDELSLLFGNGTVVIFVILVVIPSVASQTIAMIVFGFANTYFWMIILRFCQLYAPPELFGTFQGGYAFVIGVCQIVFATVVGDLASVIFSQGTYWQYSSQFLFWCAGVLLTAFLMAWWVCFKQPLKKPGVATMVELRDVQSQRGLLLDVQSCVEKSEPARLS